MKLHEYQAKNILNQFGVPIPKGRVANFSTEAKQIADELGGKVVIKAQVLVGGRGKAGGIKLAKDSNQAKDLATEILSMTIKGLPVRKVLVDEIVNFEKEIYLGITNDRANRLPIVIASSSGGVDIEEVAKNSPEKMHKQNIHPLLGLQAFQIRDLAIAIDLDREYWKQFIQILQSLYKLYVENDATLAEINPLVITRDRRLLALDAKMIIDDNALFRHPEMMELKDVDLESPAESEAQKYGITYIKLDGDIGCMVNGAGLAMATMDIISNFGGQPANFLDIGGGAGASKVSMALKIILSDPNVKVILINIFGGITRCDEVAKGVLSVIEEIDRKIPFVVRLVGTNAQEGKNILSDANIQVADTLVEAAKLSISALRGGAA